MLRGMNIRMILPALLLALSALAVRADDPDPARLDALIPIGQAVDLVAARYQGRMIAAEIVEEEDRPFYEFRWLTPQGNVLRVRLDGETGGFVLVDGVGQTEARVLP